MLHAFKLFNIKFDKLKNNAFDNLSKVEKYNPMNFSKPFIQVTLLVLCCMMLLSCKENKLDEPINIGSLTLSRGAKPSPAFSQILRIALEKALSDENLPMQDELMKNHFIKDSILLCIDTPESMDKIDFPVVGNFKFKLLPKEELCRMLIEKKGQATPPYLYIHSIESSANTMQLKIDNSCISVAKVNSNADACDYLGHCGGGMEIYCTKEGAIWVGEITDRWMR